MSRVSTTTAAHDLPGTEDVVCTLFEGDYHKGAAVLMNALLKAGFGGKFCFGYRGDLPSWTRHLQRLDAAEIFRVTGNVTVSFEKLGVTHHLTNYKPHFLRKVFQEQAAERLFYFDPDIVTQASWGFFRRWADFGIALCEEAVNGSMPTNHPIRLMWMEFMRAHGYAEPQRTLSRYYNGGFIGISRQNKAFLDLWAFIIDRAVAEGLDLHGFMAGSRELPFHASDQDALNIAAMYSPHDLSTIGPEGMGFVGGGFTMSHANQGTKPWRKHFLREVLAGLPPLQVDRKYLESAAGPIQPFHPLDLAWRRATLGIAVLIGRFYHRA